MIVIDPPWRSGFGLEWRGHLLEPATLWRRMARRLSGAPPRQVLVSESGSRLFNLMLALLLPRLGHPFLPLDPRLPQTMRRRLVAQVAAAGLEIALRASPARPHPLQPSDPWLLPATSGTTGAPRLVALTGGQWLAAVQAANRLLELSPGDRWLLCLPAFHVGGLAVPWRCALAGATVVVEEGFHAPRLLRRLARGDVTHLSLVPTQLWRLLQADDRFRPPAALRVVLLGGAPARESLVHQALERGWPVCPSYGLTEAASQVATCYPPPSQWRSGEVGEVLPHVEVRLDGQGHILLRGPGVARYGYDESGRVGLVDEAGWLHTGDLGAWTDDGALQVLGRRDDLILSGGEKIRPQWVEERLAGLPGIGEVAVVGVPDAEWGMRLVAFYTGSEDPDTLQRLARERLRGPLLPKGFQPVVALPRTATGKLQRRRLAALWSSGKRM